MQIGGLLAAAGTPVVVGQAGGGSTGTWVGRVGLGLGSCNIPAVLARVGNTGNPTLVRVEQRAGLAPIQRACPLDGRVPPAGPVEC